MNELFASLNPIASMAASALISALWEGLALAGLVWLVLRAFPRLSAAARGMVWLGVFALLIGLQVLPLALPGVQAGGDPYGSAASYKVHVDPRWGYGILGLWAVFSLVRAVQLGIGVVHLRRLAKRAVVVSDHPSAVSKSERPGVPVNILLDEIAAGRRVRLCVSDEIARPSVIGFFQPKILIPARLLESLPEDELKQVLIHEMEHLRRADDWTNLLQKLALVAFPLNPALAWVERRLCAERELACDDRVLEAGNGRKAYAMCLAHLAEHAMLQRGMSLALGAWEKRPELVRRVERILRGERTLGRRLAMGVTGTVMAASLCVALGLSRSPEMVSFAPMPLAVAENPDSFPQGLKPMPVVDRENVRANVAVLHPVKASMVSSVEPKLVLSHPCAKGRAWMGHPRLVGQPKVRLAELRRPMEKAPGGDGLLVMAEWNDLGVQQRIIWATLRQGMEPAEAVPAVYLVATPNGWVIVQI